MAVSLKTQNIVPMTSLVILSMSVAWWVAFGGLEPIPEAKESLLASGTATIVVLLLASILPANLKDIIVFWRVYHCLPGHRFISLIDKDSRLSLEQLEVRFPEIAGAISPEKQNQFWYQKLYKPVSGNTHILAVHKSYLLYRDTASIIFILSLIFLVLAIAELPVLSLALPIQFPVILFAEYILLIWVARNNANRFVTNAVAESIASK